MKEDSKSTKARSYTEEFKENLIELVLQGERTVNQAAKDFGVPKATLAGWVRRRGWKGKAGRPSAEPANDTERELLALRTRNAELERKVRRLEEDREILKKATAFFAKHQP